MHFGIVTWVQRREFLEGFLVITSGRRDVEKMCSLFEFFHNHGSSSTGTFS
jgi:hypothetical protein